MQNILQYYWPVDKSREIVMSEGVRQRKSILLLLQESGILTKWSETLRQEIRV